MDISRQMLATVRIIAAVMVLISFASLVLKIVFFAALRMDSHKQTIKEKNYLIQNTPHEKLSYHVETNQVRIISEGITFKALRKNLTNVSSLTDRSVVKGCSSQAIKDEIRWGYGTSLQSAHDVHTIRDNISNKIWSPMLRAHMKKKTFQEKVVDVTKKKGTLKEKHRVSHTSDRNSPTATLRTDRKVPVAGQAEKLSDLCTYTNVISSTVNVLKMTCFISSVCRSRHLAKRSGNNYLHEDTAENYWNSTSNNNRNRKKKLHQRLSIAQSAVMSPTQETRETKPLEHSLKAKNYLTSEFGLMESERHQTILLRTKNSNISSKNLQETIVPLQLSANTNNNKHFKKSYENVMESSTTSSKESEKVPNRISLSEITTTYLQPPAQRKNSHTLGSLIPTTNYVSHGSSTPPQLVDGVGRFTSAKKGYRWPSRMSTTKPHEDKSVGRGKLVTINDGAEGQERKAPTTVSSKATGSGTSVDGDIEVAQLLLQAGDRARGRNRKLLFRNLGRIGTMDLGTRLQSLLWRAIKGSQGNLTSLPVAVIEQLGQLLRVVPDSDVFHMDVGSDWQVAQALGHSRWLTRSQAGVAAYCILLQRGPSILSDAAALGNISGLLCGFPLHMLRRISRSAFMDALGDVSPHLHTCNLEQVHELLNVLMHPSALGPPTAWGQQQASRLGVMAAALTPDQLRVMRPHAVGAALTSSILDRMSYAQLRALSMQQVAALPRTALDAYRKHTGYMGAISATCRTALHLLGATVLSTTLLLLQNQYITVIMLL